MGVASHTQNKSMAEAGRDQKDDAEELRSVVMALPTPKPAQDDPRSKKMGLRQGYRLGGLLKGNVTYVASTVLMQEDRVLLVQEAHPRIRGLWYLPAGLVDPNETVATAAKREVKEEAGVEVELDALIAVESRSSRWVRFTFTGHIVGGSLKIPDNADRESIQAQWFTFEEQCLPQLRGHDILGLIRLAKKWYAAASRTGCAPHRTLPVHVGHTSSSIRVIAVHRDKRSALSVLTLQSAFSSTSYPVCLYGSDSPLVVMVEALKSCGYEGPVDVKGVLSVEHLGTSSLCGVCISLLVEAGTNTRVSSHCKWTPVGGEVADRLHTILTGELGCTLLWSR